MTGPEVPFPMLLNNSNDNDDINPLCRDCPFPMFTGLVEADGTERWIKLTQQAISIKSPPVCTHPGKIEQHTIAFLSYEIPADSLVKDAFVDVWDDAGNTHYRMGVPTYIGTTYLTGPWFSLSVRHEYVHNKRVFTCHLENWSHKWGRCMQLNLGYEVGICVPAPTV